MLTDILKSALQILEDSFGLVVFNKVAVLFH